MVSEAVVAPTSIVRSGWRPHVAPVGREVRCLPLLPLCSGLGWSAAESRLDADGQVGTTPEMHLIN